MWMYLENPTWELKSHPDLEGDDPDDETWPAYVAEQTEYRSTRGLNTKVPIVSQWMIHAGDVMLEKTPEKWSLWKERFEWVQTVPELTEETKAWAKQSLDSMSRAEGRAKK